MGLYPFQVAQSLTSFRNTALAAVGFPEAGRASLCLRQWTPVSLTFVGGAGLGTEWPLQVLRSCVTILD